MHERRREDERFERIIEQSAEIKALIGTSIARIEALTKEQAGHSLAISEIRWALWGGPKESDIGLIEKHRKLARNWVIAGSICAFLFSALGKIASPLWNKAVTDWVYNSPSQKWEREQKRPKVRVYKVTNPSPNERDKSEFPD